MTAYLMLPSIETGLSRRVDFENIGHLFADPDEVQPRPRRLSRARVVLTGLLILICAIGDAVLVAWPDALSQTTVTLSAGPNGGRPANL